MLCSDFKFQKFKLQPYFGMVLLLLCIYIYIYIYVLQQIDEMYIIFNFLLLVQLLLLCNEFRCINGDRKLKCNFFANVK